MKERSDKEAIDPLHVLVVDDEPIIRELLQAMLCNMHVSVTLAGNGVEAQRKILSGSYQLVITDINMPEMDGIALLRWLKIKKPDIDIVVMTGYDLTRDMLKTIGDTAMECFVKPLEPVKVHAAVQHCRARIRLRDNMR